MATPIEARDLDQVSSAIANRAVAFRGYSTVVVTHGMWERASPDAKVIFINMCRIHGLKHRLETPALGGAFLE